MMTTNSQFLWDQCLEQLQQTLPAQLFNMWLRPLQFHTEMIGHYVLFAPNHFVKDWVESHYLPLIHEAFKLVSGKEFQLTLQVGSKPVIEAIKTATASAPSDVKLTSAPVVNLTSTPTTATIDRKSRRNAYSIPLNPNFNFRQFVIGKSNQLALAAAKQVAENPGTSYNPLFIYGAVGLGKTHLMQAVGNEISLRNPQAKIVYLSSERYVSEMVRAIQTNSMESFKEFYRTCDLMLIDDIQFFAGKDRSQEEFFHTFNELLEGHQQMIFTCDRYPREIDGLEDRLKSRFGWGLTVAVEPPELETRVAILISKAEQNKIVLPEEVAFFIGKRLRSNVRELEGALKRVIAHIHFTGQEITLDVVKEALRDLISLQDRLVTIENIQKTVAEYYKIRVADITAARRTRSVARPRQMAMALAKELTNHSLPEIGAAFGGRDHTTVLHACKKVQELIQTDKNFAADYQSLLRVLTG